MPDFYVEEGFCYCSLCDRYFPHEDARAVHIEFSHNHPKCDKCDIRFSNGNALRVHYSSSHRHNYCVACDQHFRTRAGFRAHVELAAIHNDNDDDSDDEDDSIDDSYEGWEDDVGEERFPEENDLEEPSAEDENTDELARNYWPEDRERRVVEAEEDTYNGWAPVPPPDSEESDDSSSDTEDEQAEKHVCADSCKDTACTSTAKAKPSAAVAFVLNCPVCLEATSTPTATSCGHIFCSSCIHRCMKTERSCPVCRRAANPRDLRRLFLEVA